MATYKLKKDIANAQSFRFNGVKYMTKEVSQKQLAKLHAQDCAFVVEEKAKAKAKPSKKKSNEEETQESGSATE